MSDREPRSTNHLDYQNLPQTLAAMAKDFTDGFLIEEHAHECHQLLYATSGVMRLHTANENWIVPNDRAIYIPAGTPHSVKMYGAVTMRTLYINSTKFEFDTACLRVIYVTPLMRELITALSKEAIAFQPGSRAEKIESLLIYELESAQDEALNIPLPADSRLQKLCSSLLADPSDDRTLNEWGHFCGASARTLSRLFETELGMSFRRWRQLIRFHSAIEALSQGKSIAQVAHDNGYRSPSAFSAAFHAFIGQPPSTLVNKSDSSKLSA